MNKIYKLVYSKTLNSLVAVSEIAKRSQAASGSVDISEADLNASANGKANLNKLALTFVISSLFSALPLGASAQTKQVEKTPTAPVATATANTDVTKEVHFNYVSKAGYSESNAGVVADTNGPSVKYVENVPVVNIVKADANGVSDNRFSKFSTDTGVVFNNVVKGSQEVKASFLSQKIAANPNLEVAARAILAQITGNDKSVINGTMEVLGAKADLIVVNPNGIDLNGVDLVNMRSFTASTAEVNSNNYKTQTIQKGEININDGLSYDDIDTIRLLAAAVKVKAQIAPKVRDGRRANIVVAGGKQKFDLEKDTATALSQEANAEQKVVISGDALGSMYGNKVNFVVSESGAGIDYDGLIIGEEDLQIVAKDGNVRVQKTFSNKDTIITATKGTVEVKEGGSVKSLGRITVAAKNVNSAKGTLHASKAVQVSVKESADLGEIQASKVRLISKKGLTTAEGTKIRANELNVTAKTDVVFGGKVVANKKLTVNVDKETFDKVTDTSTAAEDAAAAKEYTSSVTFNDEVVAAGQSLIQAGTVKFQGKSTGFVKVKSNITENEFRFNNLTLQTNTELKDSFKVTNGAFVANNLNIEVFKPNNLEGATPLVSLFQGAISVFQTATLDLNKGAKLATVNSPKAFSEIKRLSLFLGASAVKVKAGDVAVKQGDTLNFNRSTALTFDAKSFTNSGKIITDSSFAVLSKNDIRNDGVMAIKGNLVLSSEANVDLSGAVFTYAGFDVKGHNVTQQGTVRVGGDMTVTADQYKISSIYTGKASVKDSNTHTVSQVNHHHRARIDQYDMCATFGAVDSDSFFFKTAETNVVGNLTVKPLTQPVAGNSDVDVKRLVVENSRLYVGGDTVVDGSVEVKASSFKVAVADLLKHKQPVKFSFVPKSIFGHWWTGQYHFEFNSLYDFFHAVATNNLAGRNHIGYEISREQVLNAFKETARNMDSSMAAVVSSVLGADWKGLTVEQFSQRFQDFQKKEGTANIALFAPDAEMISMGNFTQRNGSLFVGADDAVKQVAKSAHQEASGATKISLESSSDVFVAKKLKNDKTYSQYVTLLKDRVAVKSGKQTIALTPSWVEVSDVLGTFSPTGSQSTVAATNELLNEVVLAQYKDRVGGYLAAGREGQDIVKDLVEQTKKYKAANASIKYQEGSVKVKATIDGVEREYANLVEAKQAIANKYSRIEWIESRDGYVPTVVVSQETLLKTTNFDEVAASLSAVKSVTTENNSGVKVAHGSINTRYLKLDSNGNIDLTSLKGQNSINADKTDVRVAGNFDSVGNLRVGNLKLEAVGDVNLNALSFFNSKGELAHQAKLEATEVVKVVAKNISLESVKLDVKDKVELKASENIDVKATHSEASLFTSSTSEDSTSGVQIAQAAKFVEATEIAANEISIEAGEKLTLESAVLDAGDKLDITAGELETKAKADEVTTHAEEQKFQLTTSAQANFGGYAAGVAAQVLKNRNVEDELEENVAAYATANAPVQSGSPISATVGISNVQTTLDTSTKTHVNNVLDAKETNITVKGHAELGNTDINSQGAVKEAAAKKSGAEAAETILDDYEKVANIKAESVSQNNAKDVLTTQNDTKSFSLGFTSYVNSSAVDALSHAAANTRAAVNGEELDATLAATVVGDVVGLVTKDLASIGGKLAFSSSKAHSEEETVVDSRNKVSGTLNIETSGDTQLKAVDADLKELNVKAKNFTVEGGEAETRGKHNEDRVDIAVDVSLGVGLTGPSASVSSSFALQHKDGSSEAVKQQSSHINVKNANIEVEEKVALVNTAITAEETVKVKAAELEVVTKQDTLNATETSQGLSLAVGTSIGSKVPFGSAGATFGNHNEKGAVTTKVAGISGDKVEVEADSAKLVGAVISANKEGKLDVKNIEVTKLEDKLDVDGFNLGLQLGTNKHGAAIATISGGRDAQEHYKAEVNGVVTDTIKVAEDAVVTGDELNRDASKALVVTEDKKVKETVFDLTITSTMIDDIKSVVDKARDQAANVASAVSEKLDKLSGGSEDAAAVSTGDATYVPHMSEAAQAAAAQGVGVYRTHPAVQGYANPYGSVVKTTSASSYSSYSSSASNPYAAHSYGDISPTSYSGLGTSGGSFRSASSSYDGGSYTSSSYNSSTGSFSSGNSSSLGSYGLNSASAKNSTSSMSSSRLSGSSFEHLLDSSTGKARYVSNHLDDVDLDNVQSVYFNDGVLSESKVVDDTVGQGVNIGGESVDSHGVATTDTTPNIEFGGNEGVSLADNSGSVTTPTTSDLSTALTEDATTITSPTLDFDTNDGSSNTISSGNGSAGTGTGAGNGANGSGYSAGNGSTSSTGNTSSNGAGAGSNYGTGAGTNSNSVATEADRATGNSNAGSSFNQGGSAGTISTGSNNANVPSTNTGTVNNSGTTVNYNNAGNDFALDFADNSTSTGGSQGSSQAGGFTTAGNQASADKGSVTGDTGSSASLTDASGTSSTGTTVVTKPTSGNSSSSQGSSSTTSASEDTAKETSNTVLVSNEESSTETASKPATSEEATSVDVDNSATDNGTVENEEEGATTTNSSTKVKEKATKSATDAAAAIDNSVEETPADGNAKSGDDIKLGDTTKVTKYQVGDLSCYVVSSNDSSARAAAQSLRDGTNAALANVADSKGFNEFMRNASRPRQTLFSTYSKGIESVVGEGGVICVPANSEVLKTDYNVVKAANDIPIVRSKSRDLEAIVVTERKMVKVKVLANNSGKSDKVVYQPTQMKIQEVSAIKSSLADKGIDASKIMILGVKSGNTESVADLIKDSVGSGETSSVNLKKGLFTKN